MTVKQPFPEDQIPGPQNFHTAMWREPGLDSKDLLAAQGIGLPKILNNPEDAVIAVDHQAKAMRFMSEMLTSDEFFQKCKKMTPDVLAKTLSYVAKTMDETARLLEYAAGRADQRTEVVGLSDLLKYLSNDEFSQVQLWLQAGMKRIESPTGN